MFLFWLRRRSCLAAPGLGWLFLWRALALHTSLAGQALPLAEEAGLGVFVKGYAFHISRTVFTLSGVL